MSTEKKTTTPTVPPAVPALPDNFLKLGGSRAIWWPEHLTALRATVAAHPEDAVKVVLDYRERAKDPDRPCGAIYGRVMALRREEGLALSTGLTRQLHGLMIRERELRSGEPVETPAQPSRLARAVDAVKAQREHDKALPDATPVAPGDEATLALVRTWHAGALPDAAFLAALKALGA